MKREDWDRRYTEREFAWTAQPNRFLVAEVGPLRPGRALDLACGEGRNAVWLAEQGWTVTGVDFSEVALARARGLADARGVDVDFVLADLLDYVPPQAAFELVVLLYLQVPFEELELVLERAAGALTSAGRLLVVGHHSDNLAEGWGGPSNPDVLYTEKQVADALADLEHAHAERVLRPVRTEEGERTAVDALVVARRAS